MPYSYSGPSVAATFVAGVFNDAEERADDLGSDAATEFGAARAAVADVPPALAEGLTQLPTITEATIELGPLLDRQAGLDAAADARATLLAGLVEQVESFMSEFFPGVEDGVATARAALVTLLAGINMADGREVAGLRLRQAEDKLTREDEDAVDTVLGDFAARGFELPPGEAFWRIGERRRKQLQALADVSFDIDMAEGGRERENLERALRLLVDIRARALAAFGTYLAAALRERYARAAAESAAQFAATQQLADRLFLQQQATNRAAALQIRAAGQDHGITRAYLTGLDRLAEQQAQDVLRRALAMAKVLAGQAATAYNAFRASAAIRASEDLNDI